MAIQESQQYFGLKAAVSLIFVSGNVVEQLILDVISKRVEQKVIRSSQRGFTKGKSFLTNLVAFYEVVTGWREQWMLCTLISARSCLMSASVT